jgi:hypothetical protein
MVRQLIKLRSGFGINKIDLSDIKIHLEKEKNIIEKNWLIKKIREL